ncbi:hypothetical protein BJ912DRAFT_1058892 [Pholiota molesta]|nr:hypothetical protein BJ912DRAFT_1058892 [Pholiota molesta]
MAKFTILQSVLLAALSLNALVSAQLGPVLGGGSGAPCARNYTVQAGDFCDAISARRTCPRMYQLATVNSAIIDPTCSNLFVGEVICLGLVGQDCTTVAVVQSGSGCADIAAQANITTPVLLANNPNVDADCTNIYPARFVLCVAPAADLLDETK